MNILPDFTVSPAATSRLKESIMNRASVSNHQPTVERIAAALAALPKQ